MDSGYLRLSVLKTLTERDLSGYDLMKHIADVIGRKPSPGSMYPLLKNLESNRLVVFKKNRRSKLYSLTKNGRKHLNELMTHRQEILTRIKHELNFMEKICGEKQPGVNRMFDRMIEGKAPFGTFTLDLAALRDIVLHASEKQLNKEQKKNITKLIQNTAREIKKVCSQRL